MLSPARPSSRSLRNISTPVHTVLAVGLDPHDLDLFVHVHDPTLHPARHHRAPTRDREHILDRHQERTVDITGRLRR